MLRLIPDQPNPENPTIGLRWCLDPKDIHKLRELGVANVKVLIVVKYENGSEDRHLSSLDEAMAYVMFRSSGKHRIFARLFWAKDAKRMERYFLERHSRASYSYSVLDYEGDGFKSNIGQRYGEPDVHEDHVDYRYKEVEGFEMDVEIGAEHFAKQWSNWVTSWANMVYPYKAQDQCQFRRRLIGAFTWQPFFVLFLFALRTVLGLSIALVGLLVCARGLTLRPLLKINDFDSLDQIWPRIDIRYAHGGFRRSARSAWIVENQYGESKPGRLLVSPIFLLLYFLVFAVISERTGMTYVELLLTASRAVAQYFVEVWRLIYADLFSFILPVVAVVAVVCAIVYFSKRFYQRKLRERQRLESSPEYLAEQLRLREEARLKALEEAASYLMCPKVSDPALAVSLMALPKQRRTFRLRFQALKRDLCRPYAR